LDNCAWAHQSSGLYIAPAVSTEKTDTVTAISAADGRSSGSAAVTINPPPTSNGTVYYISPGVNDSNDGRSIGTPLNTFATALAKLQPGDALYLMDGTYGNSINNFRPDQLPQSCQGLGVRHFFIPDPGKGAIYQIGPHLSLQHVIAPVPHVLQ
jgi:hypothetical protein